MIMAVSTTVAPVEESFIEMEVFGLRVWMIMGMVGTAFLVVSKSPTTFTKLIVPFFDVGIS